MEQTPAERTHVYGTGVGTSPHPVAAVVATPPSSCFLSSDLVENSPRFLPVLAFDILPRDRSCFRVSVTIGPWRNESVRLIYGKPTTNPFQLMRHFLTSVLWVYVLTITGPAAAETVDLKFAWPVGLKLRADCELRQHSISATETHTLTSRYTFVWELCKHANGYALEFRDYVLIRSEPARSLEPVVQLGWASHQVSALLPTLIIDGQGQPLGVEGADRLANSLRGALSKLDLQDDALTAKLTGLLLDRRTLHVRAWEDWNRMVQVWAGQEGVAIGEVFRTETPADPNAGVAVSTVWTAEVSRASASDLVALRITQKPNKTEALKGLAGMLGEDPLKLLGAGPGAEPVVELSFVTEAHPGTLIPVTYRKERKFGMVSREGKFVGRRVTWDYRFAKVAPDEQPALKGVGDGSEAAEIKQVLEDVRRLVFAAQERDTNAIAELTHPRIVELSGGKTAYLDLLQRTLKELEGAGFVVESYEPDTPPEFFSADGTDYAIIRTRSVMRVHDKRVESRNFMLGLRQPGERWTYVDGSKLHGPGLEQVFPTFPKDRPLPTIERKVLR